MVVAAEEEEEEKEEKEEEKEEKKEEKEKDKKKVVEEKKEKGDNGDDDDDDDNDDDDDDDDDDADDNGDGVAIAPFIALEYREATDSPQFLPSTEPIVKEFITITGNGPLEELRPFTRAFKLPYTLERMCWYDKTLW
uniref:Uncharacterized protein n=1 Tax=Vespula pensylvanica TaxID=30213 RepID=A0A834JPT8_VESPE|nr:hypothetical protein H0235_017405 [Vespula pensylvanica]